MLELIFLLLGALIGLAVGIFARPIATRFGLLDYPDGAGGRKLHKDVTPLVGGVGVVGAGTAGALLLLALGGPDTNAQMLLWFAFSTIGMFLLGTFDDLMDLSARFRLLVATLIVALSFTQVSDFGIHFLLFSGQTSLLVLPGLTGVAFTLLCFVGFLNAVNMADGKNGLVIGQAIIWAIVLYIRLPEWLQPMMLCLLGVLCVLFYFNIRGSLFLGDGGSYALSTIFGLLAIYCWNQGFADMRADDIALIFAVPVFDTIRLMIWRTAQGKTPFTPGRDHLHHYLYTRWGWPAPLPWVLALVAVPNFAAIALPGTGLLWLGATFAGYVAMMGIAVARPRARAA